MRTHQSTPSRQQFVRLCECGCGQPTLLSRHNQPRYGHVRGQPYRFIIGHAQRGRVGARRLPRKRHDDRGYIKCHVPDHPHADKKGDVYEHRLVMERVLGRYLLPTEEVHHENDVKSDNRPENLVVLTKAQHRRLHSLGNTRNRLTGWSHRYPACVRCGTTERKHHGRGLCESCRAREHGRLRRSAAAA